MIGLIAKSIEPPAGVGLGCRADRAGNRLTPAAELRQGPEREQGRPAGQEVQRGRAGDDLGTGEAGQLGEFSHLDGAGIEQLSAHRRTQQQDRSRGGRLYAAGPQQGDQDRAQHGGRAGLADDRRVDEITGRNPARNQEPAHVPQRPEQQSDQVLITFGNPQDVGETHRRADRHHRPRIGHLFDQLRRASAFSPPDDREQGNGAGQKHETHVHAPDDQDGHHDQVDEGDRDLHAHESGSPGCRGWSQAARDEALPAVMIALTAIAPRGPGRSSTSTLPPLRMTPTRVLSPSSLAVSSGATTTALEGSMTILSRSQTKRVASMISASEAVTIASTCRG